MSDLQHGSAAEAELAAGPPELRPVDTDAVGLLDEVPLSTAEASYVEAARTANTLRGYRSRLAGVHQLMHIARRPWSRRPPPPLR